MRLSIQSVILFVLVVALSACASPRAVPQVYEIDEGQRFAPVNLTIDAGEYVQLNTALVANYLSQAVHASGQFSVIEKAFLRWPYTINIKYNWQQAMDAAGFAGTMVSASTLLVVPGYLDEVHSLDVIVMFRDTVIKQERYSTDLRTALSLWHDPIEDRKNAVNILLEKMFTDLRSSKLIPLINDLRKQDDNPKTEI